MSQGSDSKNKILAARVQAYFVASPPPGMRLLAGFTYPSAAAVPAHMRILSSAGYSLGSISVSRAQRVAVMLFSLASPRIPDNLQRVAIIPEP